MNLVEKCEAILTVYQQILENSGTPYILVNVDDINKVRVPMQYVKDGKIVLNISMIAANNLFISENGIQFGARFSGKHYNIDVPLENVMAIYAKESGEGIFFDSDLPPMAQAMVAEKLQKQPEANLSNSGTVSVQSEQPKRPALRVVK